MNYIEYKKIKKEIDKIGRNDIILKLIEDITYENKQLKEELEVSKTNEETYCLEMQEITKILGLDEHTLFDDVKQYVKNQISILTELEEWLKAVYEDYDDWKDEYRYSTYITAINETFDKIQELKEEYK